MAVDRTHDMDERKAFVVPVVIDATPERGARVPEKFHELQWTRLLSGETPPAFIERVQRLLSPEAPTARAGATTASSGFTTNATSRNSVPPIWQSRPALWAIGALLTVALSYFVLDKLWLSKRTSAAANSAAPSATALEKSVAVLPFVDLSEKHDQEYFSDGMTEELISRLARAEDLKVIARTSSFQFKGKSEDVRSIAEKLGVPHLIEGSIRRSGPRMRVTVQVIRASDGAHLWAQSYDRDEQDALKVQDEIAEAVAQSLLASLKVDTRYTPQLTKAYSLFLQGRERVERGGLSDANYQVAIGLLEQAVQEDPRLGVAWAELSRTRLGRYIDYPQTGTHNSIRAVVAVEAEKALQLAPESAEAHVAMARVMMWLKWDWSRASTETQRALELGPNIASVQRNAFYLSMFLAHWDEAVAHMRKAAELDPLSGFNYRQLGLSQESAFSFDEAEDSYRKALHLDPTGQGYRVALASALWHQGKWAEAEAEAAREVDEVSRLPAQAYIQYKHGQTLESQKLLDEFVTKFSRFRPLDTGTLFLYLGRLDDGFMWLDRAVAAHDIDTPWLLNIPRDPDPKIARMRSDPRFRDLVRRMNLPESQ